MLDLEEARKYLANRREEGNSPIPPTMPFTSAILFKFNSAAIQSIEQLIKLLHDQQTVQAAFDIRKLLFEIAKTIQEKPMSPMQVEETAKALNETLQFILSVQHYYSLGVLDKEATKQ